MKMEIVIKKVREYDCLYVKGKNQWKQIFNVEIVKKIRYIYVRNLEYCLVQRVK